MFCVLTVEHTSSIWGRVEGVSVRSSREDKGEKGNIRDWWQMGHKRAQYRAPVMLATQVTQSICSIKVGQLSTVVWSSWSWEFRQCERRPQSTIYRHTSVPGQIIPACRLIFLHYSDAAHAGTAAIRYVCHVPPQRCIMLNYLNSQCYCITSEWSPIPFTDIYLQSY